MNQPEFKEKFNAFILKAKALLKVFGIKAWEYIKLAKIELIVIAGAVFLDLLTKFIVAKTMNLYEVITVIPNFFNFRYVHNTKAAFGGAFGLDKLLGDAGLRVFFIIITIIALSVFFLFLYRFRRVHIMGRLSLALIIGGAIGNFYDRLFLRYVRDFAEIVFFGLDLPLLGTSFAIFNIADVALVAGTIMFAVFFIFIYKTPKESFVGPVFQPDYTDPTAESVAEPNAESEPEPAAESTQPKEENSQIEAEEEKTYND